MLVAAVFDAFLDIYRSAARILSALPAEEQVSFPKAPFPTTSSTARARGRQYRRPHLNICIRALDYCPPVDLMFGEYIRALITADHDLVPRR